MERVSELYPVEFDEHEMDGLVSGLLLRNCIVVGVLLLLVAVDDVDVIGSLIKLGDNNDCSSTSPSSPPILELLLLLSAFSKFKALFARLINGSNVLVLSIV